MTLEKILKTFKDDQIIELYIHDQDTPIFANKVTYLKEVIYNIFHATAIYVYDCSDSIEISSYDIGYGKTGIKVRVKYWGKSDCVPESWWTNLYPASVSEIEDVMKYILKDYIKAIIKQSHNDIALSTISTDKFDKVVDSAVKEVDITDLLILGITRLDIKNAKSNPSNSELYKTLMVTIEKALSGEPGKQLMSILFK